MKSMDALVEVVRRLRADDGCPWDRAQTLESLRPYWLEESYEVLDALDRGDARALRGELGDQLFQILMFSQIASEAGQFTFDEVAEGVGEKMIRRHPHVFTAEGEGQRAGWGIAAWEAQKSSERAARTSALDGVPAALPALLRAHRVSEKAGKVGFDWPDLRGVREKLTEEIGELDEAIAAGDAGAIEEELGDVLFTLVNMGRHLPVTAEDALRAATTRFEARFRRLEAALAAEGTDLYHSPPEHLERLWRAVKGSSS